jgi:sensor histidine kinase regulating citrate/malate metabolism
MVGDWLKDLWKETFARALVLIGLVGNIITFFLSGLPASRLRDIAYVLAGIGFLWANFNVYKRLAQAAKREGDSKAEEIAQIIQANNAAMNAKDEEIAILKRKPYDEELGRQATRLIAVLSPEGRTLLRHLVVNEPLEMGRRFLPQITQDVQDNEISIAYAKGIVRHDMVRAGSGNIVQQNYVINPRFRSVLQDLLFGRQP